MQNVEVIYVLNSLFVCSIVLNSYQKSEKDYGLLVMNKSRFAGLGVKIFTSPSPENSSDNPQMIACRRHYQQNSSAELPCLLVPCNPAQAAP